MDKVGQNQYMWRSLPVKRRAVTLNGLRIRQAKEIPQDARYLD